MRNIALKLMYNGTAYHGWQVQKNAVTVCETLQKALKQITGENVHLTGCGRTDAGVHAEGQVASFHCESTMPAPEILAQLRRYLPEDIGIYSCKDVSLRFHARLNAREKTYRYRIWNSDTPCVFDRRYVAVLPEKLDVDAMRQAARYLEGEHDFSAFCGNPKFKKSTVRFIRSVTIEERDNELRILFTGNGFIHNQVRIMVGTLIEVGRGARGPESIPALFGGKREEAGFLAPAQGLCLMEVTY